MPLHKGHLYCIDVASQQCDRVVVIMFINGDDELEILKTHHEPELKVENRIRQLEKVCALYPNVEFYIIDDNDCRAAVAKVKAAAAKEACRAGQTVELRADGVVADQAMELRADVVATGQAMELRANGVATGQVVDISSDEVDCWDAETPLVREHVPHMDYVYSSEPSYGEYFARAYPEAKHVIVDEKRVHYPISATMIRAMKTLEEKQEWMA